MEDGFFQFKMIAVHIFVVFIICVSSCQRFQIFQCAIYFLFQLENSLADTMLEVGYSWTENLEGCRERLSSMAGEIKPGVVARVLGMMARSHTGLPSSLWPSETDKPDQPPLNTWNVDVFVQALKEVVSTQLIVIFQYSA